MAGITNRGKFLILDSYFRNPTEPTNLYVALVTNAVPPTADHNTLGQLTQIAVGNGYVNGGIQLNRNTTDFDAMSEDDTADRAFTQIKDLVWTAAGGPLPASGAGARWAILTTDEATVANRQIMAYFDLVSDRTVSAGQTLTLANCEIQLNEA